MVHTTELTTWPVRTSTTAQAPAPSRAAAGGTYGAGAGVEAGAGVLDDDVELDGVGVELDGVGVELDDELELEDALDEPDEPPLDTLDALDEEEGDELELELPVSELPLLGLPVLELDELLLGVDELEPDPEPDELEPEDPAPAPTSCAPAQPSGINANATATTPAIKTRDTQLSEPKTAPTNRPPSMQRATPPAVTSTKLEPTSDNSAVAGGCHPARPNKVATMTAAQQTIPPKTRYVVMFKLPLHKDWAFWVWAALAAFVIAANFDTIRELPNDPSPLSSALALAVAAAVVPWVFPSLIWLLPRYIIGKNRNKQIDIATDRMLYTMPPMTPRRLFMNLPDEASAKGKTFERLVKWLLQNDPRFVDMAVDPAAAGPTAATAGPRRAFPPSQIYLWGEYPNRWGPDNGIDLVAIDANGATWAIQAKAWDPDRALNKAAIDSFLAESSRKEIQARMIVTTAVEQTDQLMQSLAAQEKQVTVIDGDELAKAEVDWESSNLMPLEKYMREQGVREAREKLGLKPK